MEEVVPVQSDQPAKQEPEVAAKDSASSPRRLKQTKKVAAAAEGEAPGDIE